MSTAMIFARGGSKGVVRKNVRKVGGRALIGHAILCGLASRYIDRVCVSTDDQEIADVAMEFGAEVLQRPPSLAQDDSSELDAWKHAI